MSEPRSFTMSLEGVTPIVMNNPANLLEPKVDKGRDPAAWEKEHFLEKTYQNKTGQLVIPARAIRKMLMNGCRFITDKPKGSSFKSFAPLIEAACLVEEDAVIDVPSEKCYPLVMIVNLDPSKGPRGPRGPRCRPAVPLPWHAETIVTLIDDAMTGEHFSKLADVAGRLCGLLDGRSIGMGRCHVSVRA